MDKSDKETITKALQYLAGVCDYANKQDGVGFNAFDTQFGHDLAEKSIRYPLSENQLSAALRMITKYQRQLESAGIILPGLAVLIEKDTSANTPVIYSYPNGSAAIKWLRKPSNDDLAKVRDISRFDGQQWLARDGKLLIARFPGIRVIPVTEEQKKEFAVPSGPLTVTISKSDGWIDIATSKYQADVVTICKETAGREYNPEKKIWKIPTGELPGFVSRLEEKKIVDLTIVLQDGVKETMDEIAELRTLSRQATGDFEIPGLKLTPKEYQRAGVKFLNLRNGSAVLADEMGLGKTLQAISYLIINPEIRPAVIVVPSSLKINWLREWRMCYGQEDVVILKGRTPKPELVSGANIIIINYDILSDWLETIKAVNPKIAILDEAHLVKNPKAARTKAVDGLVKAVGRCMPMTGTPVMNRPKEIYNLLHWADPITWKSRSKFEKRYCGAGWNGYAWASNGADNLAELHEAVKYLVLRRTKDQVLKELPPKQRVSIYVEWGAGSKSAYDAILHQLEVSDLSQIKPWQIKTDVLPRIEQLKQEAVKGRMPAAIDWIENFLDTGKKLVVFATHTFVVDALVNHFKKVAVKVDGSVKDQKRDDAVQRFQYDDTVRLFVGQIAAAGVGLTLTAATDVLFMELAWRPGDHDQAEDRLHRIGQDGNVTCWYMLTEGSIDEDIFTLLEEKRAIADVVHDGVVGELDFSLIDKIVASIKKKSGIDNNL